jgi:hypothetical protein
MYYAKIDINNLVLDVIVADAEFVATLPDTWVQAETAKNSASIGATWRPDLDGFLAPKPFPSWTLNETDCKWEPPTPQPEGFYRWDEDTLAWITI